MTKIYDSHNVQEWRHRWCYSN